MPAITDGDGRRARFEPLSELRREIEITDGRSEWEHLIAPAPGPIQELPTAEECNARAAERLETTVAGTF
jgi:hypothetical protein